VRRCQFTMVPYRFFTENCVPQLGPVLTDGLKTASMYTPACESL